MRKSRCATPSENCPVISGEPFSGLDSLSDAGSQFRSISASERLVEIAAVPTIGSVGDSLDDPLAETENGYFEVGLVRGPDHLRPWKTIETLELATLGCDHWHDSGGLHAGAADIPPAELEETFHPENRQVKELAENKNLETL